MVVKLDNTLAVQARITHRMKNSQRVLQPDVQGLTESLELKGPLRSQCTLDIRAKEVEYPPVQGPELNLTDEIKVRGRHEFALQEGFWSFEGAELGRHGWPAVNQGAVVIAEEDEEVKSGPFVAVHFDMWHFGDAAVEVELRTNADGCGGFVR